MTNNIRLHNDFKGKAIDLKIYRSAIGNLFYLIVNRPDILFNVGICPRYQFYAKESHMTIVKRILKYLKGTQSV